MLLYLLKSIGCLTILWLIYQLFLEKERMHRFKRFYLLGSLLFSLAIPFITFTKTVYIESPSVLEIPPFTLQENFGEMASDFAVPAWQWVILVLYSLGFCYFLSNHFIGK